MLSTEPKYTFIILYAAYSMHTQSYISAQIHSPRIAHAFLTHYSSETAIIEENSLFRCHSAAVGTRW